MSELAAVSVGHGGQEILSVFRSPKLYFGDSREILADRIRVLAGGCAQLVKIDLLIEIHVFFGPLVAARIPRVVEARTVRVPRHAAARRSPIHAKHHVAKLLDGRDVVHVNAPFLAAPLRQRHSDQTPIERWNVEVDRCGSFRIYLIGIDDHALGGHVVGRFECYQGRLVHRRLHLHGEQQPLADLNVVVA